MFTDASSNNIRALNLECNFYLLREAIVRIVCSLYIRKRLFVIILSDTDVEIQSKHDFRCFVPTCPR